MEIIIVGGIIFWIVRSIFFNSSSNPKCEVSIRAGRESTPEEEEREERRRRAEEKDRQRTYRIGMAQLNTDIGMKEAFCPSCGVVLKEFPKRKIKCKDCGNFIYKRIRPWDKVQVLLTENQLEEFEDVKEQYRFIKYYSITNYPFYEEELKKEKGTDDVAFKEVILYRYIKEMENALKYNTSSNPFWEINDLMSLYKDLGDFENALKMGMIAAYYGCSHIRIFEEFYDTKREIQQEREKRIAFYQDSRWSIFVNKLGYSYSDVKKIFYSMDFDPTIFTADKDEVWRKCILAGLKRYENS